VPVSLVFSGVGNVFSLPVYCNKTCTLVQLFAVGYSAKFIREGKTLSNEISAFIEVTAH